MAGACDLGVSGTAFNVLLRAPGRESSDGPDEHHFQQHQSMDVAVRNAPNGVLIEPSFDLGHTVRFRAAGRIVAHHRTEYDCDDLSDQHGILLAGSTVHVHPVRGTIRPASAYRGCRNSSNNGCVLRMDCNRHGRNANQMATSCRAIQLFRYLAQTRTRLSVAEVDESHTEYDHREAADLRDGKRFFEENPCPNNGPDIAKRDHRI